MKGGRDNTRGNCASPNDQAPVSLVMEAEADEELLGEEDADSNFYPIFLPIDRNYETKYLFHYRHLKKRGKTMQERTYVFLEHPIGWGCFIYHMSV